MAYDAARRQVVMFGGAAGGAPPLRGTWLWDGTDWRQATPSRIPPERWAHSMAYDAARQRVVMFGGSTQNSLQLSDTWEWDGVDWTQATPARSPTNRAGHALVYDEVRQRVLMFGGSSCQGLACSLLNDTWEWDGVNWTQLSPAQSPTARGDHVMAYDGARARVLLFGGRTSITNLFNDTWEWDGSNWSLLTPPQSPPARRGHAMAYHAIRQQMVLYGGFDASNRLLDDTWEWDGASWRPSPIPFVTPWPGERTHHAMTYDGARQHIVLVGGWNGLNYYGDTWLWHSRSPAFFNRIGTGCPGSAGMPVLDAAPFSSPWVARSYSIELSNLPPGRLTFMITGLSNTFWAGALIRLPASLVSWGMPGCTAYTDIVHSELLANSTGNAVWTKLIPNDGRLIGLTFYNQGFILDSGVNALGAIVTNAGESIVGMR